MTEVDDITTESVSAGFYYSDGWHRDFPRLQILTIEDLLNCKDVQMPTERGDLPTSRKNLEK